MNPQSPHATEPDNGNGTGSPLGDHGPIEERPGFFRRHAPFLWIGGTVALALLVFAGLVIYRFAVPKPFDGLTYTVKKEVLRLTIVERGNLESAENSDITCRVKAKTQGGTIASTIKWVIDDGT
jgi:hypothetical protein